MSGVKERYESRNEIILIAGHSVGSPNCFTDIRNSLREIGNQEKWFQWIDTFGNYVKSKRDVSDTLKKELLKTVLDFVSVDYDWEEKVHRLYIHFKLPVFQQGNVMEIGNRDKYLISKSKENGIGQPDQLTPPTYYSTVIPSPQKGRDISTTVRGRYKAVPIGQGVTDRKSSEYNPAKGYSLRMSVELVSANLWESPYTLYQQEVYDIIRKHHDDDGWNFKQISDW